MLWTTKHCERYEWLDILWAKASRCYEQLRVVDDMNDSTSRAKGGGWHEWLWVMSSRLKILWITQGCGWYEWLWVVNSRLWMLWAAQSCRCYERLRIPWAQATRYYEQLRATDNMNDSWSWTYGFNFYEYIKDVDNITILGRELTAQDVMNSPRLMMTWPTSGHGLRGLNAMNSSGLLMTWTTSSHVLRADAMNNSSL